MFITLISDLLICGSLLADCFGLVFSILVLDETGDSKVAVDPSSLTDESTLVNWCVASGGRTV